MSKKKLTSQEKKIWFRKIYVFLRTNKIPFRMGWRPQLQALEELAGCVSREKDIHRRVMETRPGRLGADSTRRPGVF